MEKVFVFLVSICLDVAEIRVWARNYEEACEKIRRILCSDVTEVCLGRMLSKDVKEVLHV